MTVKDRATLPTEIEITAEMIAAGASVLACFDRLEMSQSYAEVLAEEIILKGMRARRTEIEITPQIFEEFEAVFLEWKSSYPTADQLEAGGTGDLHTLARDLLSWASDLSASSKRG